VIAQEEKRYGPRVGDTVVYAAHGIGRVVARERKQVGDSERECIVLELVAGGLRVTLPLEEAVERLRAVADEEEFEAVRRTLLSESPARDKQWTKRISESKAKLASGRPTELAELVRDGSRVERLQGSQMSHAERRVYAHARDLLTKEIASACRLEPDEAEAWIEAHITPPEGSED
jgi:CarD family transcriptional regulator